MSEPTRELRILPDSGALAAAAADLIATLAAQAIADHGRFSIALSGGSTPRAAFTLLAQRNAVDWTRTQIFWSDERSVPPDDPDSNYRMAREALLEPAHVPPENVHRMPGEVELLVAAADAYAAELRSALGAGRTRTPRLDLILLGLGPDGHTASLFPHTDVLQDRHRIVAANFVPRLQTNRLTFTPKLINAAAAVCFIVAGADKADALAAVREGAPGPDEYPAQLVHPEEGALYWLVDEAAAARLRTRT